MSNFIWYPLAGLLCSRHLQPIKDNTNIKLFPKNKKKRKPHDKKKYNHVTFSFGAPSSLLAPPAGHQLKNIDKVWNEENLSRGLTSSLTLWPSLE